ncbi:uncharacterized protein TNCV_1557291 [Trichonephila clavipes]|nr:uncharacterized protein TNCV_1557291 [Trichonephila clavipes]
MFFTYPYKKSEGVMSGDMGDEAIGLPLSIPIAKSTVKSLNDVRSQVKSAYQSNSAVTDIDVTFDGTWLTRGHSSQIGVGCV